MLEIRSRLDFDVSARGWCYLLEPHGLGKGDFNRAEGRIVECRKQGLLPLDIVAEDGARSFDNLEGEPDADPGSEAENVVDYALNAERSYYPFSFWRDLPVYCEMLVEKVDLKSLFGALSATYQIPIANARGWSDLNSRAAMMRRFARAETEGKRIVLLYCGDHDPIGLSISDCLLSNMRDLARAVGWSPEHLVVDRFGLNVEFIDANNLTWIEGLETGSGRRLDDPTPDHHKPHVQEYLRRFGPRKVEANTLVAAPEAGRELCRQAILRHLPEDAPETYLAALAPFREELHQTIMARLHEEFRA